MPDVEISLKTLALDSSNLCSTEVSYTPIKGTLNKQEKPLNKGHTSMSTFLLSSKEGTNTL